MARELIQKRHLRQFMRHFVIAVWRAKKAECAQREGVCDYARNFGTSVSDTRAG
jgi:hypothetical protein